MAYSTEAEVRNATGMQNTTNISSGTVVSRIAFADGVINGKIGSVYQLPLSVTCELIHFCSVEIASLMLALDNYGEETQNTDKGWQKKLNAIYAVLEDIRTLKIQLFDANGVELTRNTLRTPAFYPTDASSDPGAVNSTEPKITINQKF